MYGKYFDNDLLQQTAFPNLLVVKVKIDIFLYYNNRVFFFSEQGRITTKIHLVKT